MIAQEEHKSGGCQSAKGENKTDGNAFRSKTSEYAYNRADSTETAHRKYGYNAEQCDKHSDRDENIVQYNICFSVFFFFHSFILTERCQQGNTNCDLFARGYAYRYYIHINGCIYRILKMQNNLHKKRGFCPHLKFVCLYCAIF